MSERKSIVPESIFLDETLSRNAMRVYGVLCAYADKDDGTCYPSRNTLGEKLKIAPKKVFNYLQELINKGYITKAYRHRENGTCTSNLYTIVGYVGLIQQKHEEQQEGKVDYPQNGDSIPKEGIGTIPKMGITTIPDLGIGTIPKMGIGITTQENYPLNNPGEQTDSAVPALVQTALLPEPAKPKTRSQKAKEDDLSSLALPEWLPEPIWQQFVLHRQRIKAPLSVNAAELMFKKLEAAQTKGWSPEELLSDAVANNWKGCVFDKHKQQNPNGVNGKITPPLRRANQPIEPTPEEVALRQHEEFKRTFEERKVQIFKDRTTYEAKYGEIRDAA